MKLSEELVIAACGLLLTAIVCSVASRRAAAPQRCPPGLVARGARCCGTGQTLHAGRCTGASTVCENHMTATPSGCTGSSRPVSIAGGELLVAPSDWEAPDWQAQGHVSPRRVRIAPFAIDSHEASEAQYSACVRAKACPEAPQRGELGLPQTHIDAPAAEQFCRWRGGRLPSRDEYAYAVMGHEGRRYPWGQTGAVCRRVSFGLEHGPCAHGGSGPELSGARPDGVSPDGVFDLAGNVAEWTVVGDGRFEVRGGSWRTQAAAVLRGWYGQPRDPRSRGDDVGVRCAYDSTAAKGNAKDRSTKR
jgi:hypothetical protein